jgi:hypothetical protein
VTLSGIETIDTTLRLGCFRTAARVANANPGHTKAKGYLPRGRPSL